MSLAAPYYVFRPSQIIRRLAKTASPVTLPWGDLIECDPREPIGHSLIRNGVFELAVSEFLWRLTEPGDVCVDVGANIGYMTSILAHRAGNEGRVLSFEPHPHTRATLARNANRWTSGAAIDVSNSALSSVIGEGTLVIDQQFERNQGTAHLASGSSAGAGYRVRLDTLDHAILGPTAIGVMKMDVEGHELSVLAGARDTLRAGAIRDIVYEDHLLYPSPVSRLLEATGYRVFAVQESFFGPVLAAASKRFARN